MLSLQLLPFSHLLTPFQPHWPHCCFKNTTMIYPCYGLWLTCPCASIQNACDIRTVFFSNEKGTTNMIVKIWEVFSRDISEKSWTSVSTELLLSLENLNPPLRAIYPRYILFRLIRRIMFVF